MSDLEKKTTGAPSSDTTSALFVSARKKQLEQQEEERVAREKEEKRLAAEAEVRRLEKEVEERRKKAEEAAAMSDSELSEAAISKPALTSTSKTQRTPSDFTSGKGGTVSFIEKLGRKKLMIIGGAVAAVLIAVVLIVALGGNKGVEANSTMIPYSSTQKGLSFSYPNGWVIDDSSATDVFLMNKDLQATVFISDITAIIQGFMDQGMEITSAAEACLKTMAEGISGGKALSDYTPSLQKSGSAVTGGVSFRYINDDGGFTDTEMFLFVIDERTLMYGFSSIDEKTHDKALKECDAIIGTLEIITLNDAGAAKPNAPAKQNDTPAKTEEPAAKPTEIPAGYAAFSNSEAGIAFFYPEDWDITAEGSNYFQRPVVKVQPSDNTGILVLVNYTLDYRDFIKTVSSSGEDVLSQFLSDFLENESGSVDALGKLNQRTTDNGAEQFSVAFSVGDVKFVAYVNILESQKECLAFVCMAGDNLDAMNAILGSVELFK